jgi:hypothetical protein
MIQFAALSLAAVAALGSTTAMANVFHPGKHKVCHVERHHHHNVRICHWRR